jgi:hypothetical protein
LTFSIQIHGTIEIFKNDSEDDEKVDQSQRNHENYPSRDISGSRLKKWPP